MSIKNISKHFFLLITIFFSLSMSAASGLVKISDSKRSICGFLVKKGGKKYLYTSQTALFGMHLTGVGYKFNATSFSGHQVKVNGPLMISAYSDVARVEVTTDADDLLKIGKIKDFGEQVTIFPDALKNDSDKPATATLSGIGVDTLALNAKLDSPIAGTPVLNSKKEVIGVLSSWIPVVTTATASKNKSEKKPPAKSSEKKAPSKSSDKKNKSAADKKSKSASDKKSKSASDKKSKSASDKKSKSASDKKNKSNSDKKSKTSNNKKDTASNSQIKIHQYILTAPSKGKSKGGKGGSNKTSKPSTPPKAVPLNTPTFKVEFADINRGARLDVNIRWVLAKKVDFISAGNVIYDSDRMLKEYMPILAWWLQTPYSSVPYDLPYPKELKRFVQYNNEKTTIIRKLVAEIHSKPTDHIGEMNKIRTACLHRADLFLNFPMNQVKQLNVPWKIPFLRDEGVHYSREWNKIIQAIQARIRTMKYQVPF